MSLTDAFHPDQFGGLMEDSNATSSCSGSSSNANNFSKSIIINELLCYVVSSINKYSIDTVKTTAAKFYTDEEISKGKAVLCNFDTSKLVKQIHQNRKGENKKFRELDDILCFLNFLDEKSLFNTLPTFVAADLERIPKYTSDETVTAVLSRMSSLEQQMQDLRELVAKNSNSISNINTAPPRSFVDVVENKPANGAKPDAVPRRPPLRLKRLGSLAASADF